MSGEVEFTCACGVTSQSKAHQCSSHMHSSGLVIARRRRHWSPHVFPPEVLTSTVFKQALALTP